MIPELESGNLTVDLPRHGLRAGDVGVVVLGAPPVPGSVTTKGT